VFNIFCIGAGVLGALLGYFFGYTTRNQQPSTTEFTTLFSTVLGGTVLTLLGQFQCADVLPVYVIGVAVGYVIYIGLVALHWNAIAGSMEEGSLSRVPLFPSSIPPRRRHEPKKDGTKNETPADMNSGPDKPARGNSQSGSGKKP